MFRSGLVAIALLALLGPARAADDGCEKFAWSLARERAAFAAPDKVTIAAGEALAAFWRARWSSACSRGCSPSPCRRSESQKPSSGTAAWCDYPRWQSPASTRSLC